MIYPKTIFRCVIALAAVSASTQLDVAHHFGSTNGVKDNKGGRYIDTTDAYGTISVSVLSPPAYDAASASVKNQTNTNLHKVTSPASTGVKFSYASPTNAVSVGNSRFNARTGPSSSPRSFAYKDDTEDKIGAQNDVYKSNGKHSNNNNTGVSSKNPSIGRFDAQPKNADKSDTPVPSQLTRVDNRENNVFISSSVPSARNSGNYGNVPSTNKGNSVAGWQLTSHSNSSDDDVRVKSSVLNDDRADTSDSSSEPIATPSTTIGPLTQSAPPASTTKPTSVASTTTPTPTPSALPTMPTSVAPPTKPTLSSSSYGSVSKPTATFLTKYWPSSSGFA